MWRAVLPALALSACFVEARVGAGRWEKTTHGGFCSPCPADIEWSQPSIEVGIAAGVVFDAHGFALHVARGIGRHRERDVDTWGLRLDADAARIDDDVTLRTTFSVAEREVRGDRDYSGREYAMGATLAWRDDLAATLGWRYSASTGKRRVDAAATSEYYTGPELRLTARLGWRRVVGWLR